MQGNFDVKKICDEILLVNQNVRSLVYAILTMEKFEDENYFSLIGHLNWKKINILDMAIEYNESFDEKAISLNNINVTYSKLMKKIIDRIDIFKSIG